jgi:hypothetical protein
MGDTMTDFEKWLQGHGLDRFYCYANEIERITFACSTDEWLVRLRTVRDLKNEIYKLYQDETRDISLITNRN